MPSPAVVLSTWSFDPWALGAIIVAAVLYAVGIRAAARNGVRWHVWRTVAFYVLGLGSYAVIELGFLGTWSHDLRWAFTTRVALLLFLTPGMLALGRPLTLARAALDARGQRSLEAVMSSWPIKLLGNAMVAPLVALTGFMVFLTPLAAPLRLDPGWAVLITLGIPLIGLAMSLPIAEDIQRHTGTFILVEFLLAFVELMLDAIPGILLRLNPHILDRAAAVVVNAPAWFPSPIRDQQLSGDLLWFIAEMADVPVLIVLFLRWGRVDKRDAKTVDELSDEEYEAQVQAHLRSYGS